MVDWVIVSKLCFTRSTDSRFTDSYASHHRQIDSLISFSSYFFMSTNEWLIAKKCYVKYIGLDSNAQHSTEYKFLFTKHY